MKLAVLKNIRVIVSIVFFFALSVLFLDFGNWLSPAYTNYFTYLQFVPSLIKFTSLVSITSAGFIFVILLTLLFGRVYCSTICPIGTLQDFISYLKKRLNKKNYHKLLKANNKLRYSFLILTLIVLMSGSLLAINLLDPYSNFGRIITQLFKPILLVINNLIAFTLNKFNYYSFYPVEIKSINALLALFPFLFLILIFVMAYKQGRLFCNTVCPVGTLLGLLSKFSIFKIRIDTKNCISCNLCERVCKSGCIDKKNKEVDFTRCVNCYNCFTVCPSKGITYKNSFSNKVISKEQNPDYEKREFIKDTFLYFIALSGLSFTQQKIIPKKPSTVQILKKYPVTAPGSLSIENFNSLCTACHLCISACPTQVLQPAFLEYGFTGMLQPRMDYKKSFCNYECIICSQVCPTNAISPIKLEDKKLTQLGKTNFVKENCIVYTENKECGACAEHCPTKAVTMIPYKNLRAPEIKNEYCIGCGACEYACPTQPYKAIYVDGNPVHQMAKKKEEKKIKKKINYDDDFPF